MPWLLRDPGWKGAFAWGAIAGAGLALWYFVPSLPVLLAGALLFVAVAAWRLDAALGWVLITAPLYRYPRQLPLAELGLDMLGQRAPEFVLLEFTILAATAGWLVRLVLDTGWRRRLAGLLRALPWPVLAPVLLLVLAACLSLLASLYLAESLRELRRVILEPVLFAGLLAWQVRGWREARGWLDALVLLGLGMALFSIFHYFVIGVVERTGGVERVLAIYHSPNELALFLGRIAPVAIVLLLFGERDRWRVALYGVASAALVFTLAITFSRGAWLGVAAGVALAVLLRGQVRWLVAAGAAVAVGLAVLVVAGAGERALGLVTGLRRLYLWQSALAMIRDSPVLGVGLDNFLYRYREEYILPEAALEPDLSHPHNILLDFWTRTGVLGVAAMVWLQVLFWRWGWRIRALPSAPARVAGLALMASMTDFLVHGLIDNSFFLADLAVLFWFTWVLMRKTVAESP